MAGMAKTAYVNVRIDATVKREVEKIFRELGLSVSEAITLFFRQVILKRGLTFDVSLPKFKDK